MQQLYEKEISKRHTKEAKAIVWLETSNEDDDKSVDMSDEEEAVVMLQRQTTENLGYTEDYPLSSKMN